ncbi:DEAD/DEAH box helicase [Dysgonomonas sp. 521]|uniref:DEAD/DEAH box helicase n=1 Tax=Dysgonomonas sp. 521 TaxID=2302932 RepID=UPI0013D5ECE0|nr:DEAD/DEAH box helicase [Dysgonomonas sp. 521]NDV96493.1 DEAD/DEAH box helicase [Dysgonomonas sp. 521]
MMIADKIYKLNSFKRQYEALLILSVCDTMPQLAWTYDRSSLLGVIDWSNILGIASILSYSTNSQHLEAALRIAQTCLTLDSCTGNEKNASAVILDSLTNKLAIKMAIDRQYINSDYKNNYPVPLKIQKYKSDFEHSILINNQLISLNRFQKDVYDAHTNNGTISISAPTSAGKSFILCTILLEELLDGNKNIVYLVPTRALISQVEADLRGLVKKNKMEEKVNISTVPPQEDIDRNKSNVFVFTQERLHWFLIGGESIPIHMLIIDEAHKIEDGNRGILLQQKLEETVKRNPKVKVYFSSPYTSNPEILLDNVVNNSKKDKVNTQFVAVNQNLIYATQRSRKPDQWRLQMCTVEKSIDIGTINLKDKPAGELHKIVLISESFSDGQSGSLIYCNGAADAERTSLLLFDLLEQNQVSDEINELIKLVKQIIHPNYTLAKVLQKNIAFHYGNMPLLIRQEIEKLFTEGKIKYLICTSTLLEGVNLPAKSIFIRRPTRGRRNPLNQNDFWNLAGRAGRWGKEFSGNIICIEPNTWDIKPEPNKSKQVIKRAINVIEEEGDEFLKFIQDSAPRSEANRRQDLEFAFGYYYIRYIINKEAIPQTPFHKAILLELQKIAPTIQLPDYIIKRNPGISPLAQQKLFDYFGDNINRIDELIPVYPSDENAFEEYTNLVGRIGKTISEYPHMLHASRAILLINWMTGKPLSYLINSSYKSYQSKSKYKDVKTLPVVIREVMDDVETFVRFRFVKDSSCYIDILRYFLELHGRQDLLEDIPQLNLWLEFGVSQKTHLSLLSLGLSRNTVIELTKYIINTQMSKAEGLVWLKEQNLEQLELSPIIIEDIKKVL